MIVRNAALRRMVDMKAEKSGDRSWFSIDNTITNAAAEIYLYDEIGMWGVMASDFVRALQGVSSPRINLHVNSPGGDVFDGTAIYNALRNHPSRVVAYVDGLAASAASFIVQAGAEIIVEPSGIMMIHNAQGIAVGESKDLRELADLLDKLSATIADIYAARTGQPAEAWTAAMNATTWYNAAESVAAGLADRIAGVKDLPAEAEGADSEQVDIGAEPTEAAQAWWAASIIGRGPRVFGDLPQLANVTLPEPVTRDMPLAEVPFGHDVWAFIAAQAPAALDGWATLVHDLTNRNMLDKVEAFDTVSVALREMLLKGDV